VLDLTAEFKMGWQTTISGRCRPRYSLAVLNPVRLAPVSALVVMGATVRAFSGESVRSRIALPATCQHKIAILILMHASYLELSAQLSLLQFRRTASWYPDLNKYGLFPVMMF
jgi:hypothetical protein